MVGEREVKKSALIQKTGWLNCISDVSNSLYDNDKKQYRVEKFTSIEQLSDTEDLTATNSLISGVHPLAISRLVHQ